ncbi:MAG TPA: RNA polymerase subunit sigma-70 [Fusobacteria bacterium]|nr:RNA polymerase subunit sigma-70 [Fusobacteriota bacterium]
MVINRVLLNRGGVLNLDLNKYLKTISKYQLLTKEEEKKLFERVTKGDKEAREQAITANLRLVVNVAKKYLHTKVPFQDLVQEGNSGLIIAVDRFDPSKGKRFSTYATFWIKQAVLRHLNDTKNIIRYPSYVVDNINKISKFVIEYKNKHSKVPTKKEISQKIEVDIKEVKRVMDLMEMSYISLDDQYESGQGFDSTKLNAEDELCRDFESSSLISMIKKLRGKEQEVMVHRFGLFGNNRLTLEKIADKLNLTRERVRQIQNFVLAKLRDRMNNL